MGSADEIGIEFDPTPGLKRHAMRLIGCGQWVHCCHLSLVGLRLREMSFHIWPGGHSDKSSVFTLHSSVGPWLDREFRNLESEMISLSRRANSKLTRSVIEAWDFAIYSYSGWS